MGISDWSSDVCSSDLVTAHALVKARETGAASLEPVIQEKGHGLVRAIGRGLGRVVDFAVIPAAGDTEVEAFDHIAGIGERDAYQVDLVAGDDPARYDRSEEHTSELQSLMRNSYAVFSLQKK